VFALARVSRWPQWPIPILLGALSVFGFAPIYWYPLAILAIAGLFLLLQRTPAKAFLIGWLFGLGWFGAGVSWVYVSLHDFGMMPAPLAGLATALFAGYLALFPGLAAWLTLRLAGGETSRWLLAAPAAWALSEWLRGTLFTGFPWQALGYTQVPASPLAGYAPVLGVYGVSWLAAVSAGALALLALRRRRAWPLVAGLVALWLAGAGLARIDWTEPDGAPVTVSLIQGNVAQDMKFEPAALLATLTRYREMILASQAELVITPETALPIFVEYLPTGFLDELAAQARARAAGLLIGVPEREPDGRYYNSMLALDGISQQVYRKSHLVPFGEFIPPGFGWIIEVLHIPLSDFSRGAPGQAPLVLAGQRLAVNICYEDVFGEELIHALPAASLMVNVSNDAWFGDSFAPWQHLQISQMRALETGRWWLRANNTGVTAILDEKGQVRAQLVPFEVGVLTGAAQGRQGLTPYARWGNIAAVLLASVALVLAAWRWRRGGCASV